jgi:hypothetical protein
MEADTRTPEARGVSESRRRLLEGAGRLTVVTPSAIALLLTSGGARAAWASGANPGNNNPVGNAGNYPPGQRPGGTGDRGNSR